MLPRTTRPWLALFVVATSLALVVGARPALATYLGINGRIAYTNLIDKGTPTARRAVFLSPGGQLSHPGTRSVSTGNSTQIFNDNDTDPAWSPDGKTLAFIRRGWNGQAQEYSIWVVKPDGSDLRLVADQFDAAGNPTYLNGKTPSLLAWSPDGKRIGYMSTQTNRNPFFAAVLAASGDVPSFSVPVPNPTSAFGVVNGFDWGPAGIVHDCRTLWTGPTVLFCTESEGGGFATSINAIGIEHGPISQGFLLGFPRWRPSGLNGQKVMFALVYQPDPSPAPGHVEIFSLGTATNFQTNGGNYIGSGLEKNTPDDGIVTCVNTNKTTHVTTTTYARRYQYSNPVPSPDGRFFVARRSETTTTSTPQVDCAFKTEYGLHVFRNSGGMQSTIATGIDPDDAAWQPDPANLAVEISDGHGHPLDDLKVELRDYETEALTPFTGEPKAGGTYTFEDVAPGEYRIRAYLTDAVGRSFEIRHGWPNADPVELDRKVTIPPDVLQVEVEFEISGSASQIVSSNVDPLDRLDDLAAIYFQTHEFVKWVRANLTANTGSLVPIHAFATTSPGGQPFLGRYLIDPPAILFAPALSDYSNRDEDRDNSPVNGEWHEFSHHLFNQFVARFDCPGVNHAGYENANSCDSLQEGFAIFLPTQVRKDPHYVGAADLEDHIKPWNYRLEVNTGKLYSTEDLAVAALFWDLADSTTDSELTQAIAQGGVHLVTSYTDSISLSLPDLWSILTAQHPSTVAALQDALSLDSRFRNITLDVDHDLVLDVNAVDPLFLMHGFFPIVNDQTLTSTHGTYHYDVNSARITPGVEPNINVGYSGHAEYYFQTGLIRAFLHPRSSLTLVPEANLEIQARDASGTPLHGGEVELTIQYPGTQQTVRRSLDASDSAPVHLELPLYFDHLLPVDAPLPPCNPATDRTVSVTVRAIVNGFVSTNAETFDNCEYVQAMLASSTNTALSFAMQFPEDSTPPITTADRRSLGQVVGDYTVGSWTVSLACLDPVDGGFASGCDTIEYSLDSGPFRPYETGVDVTTPGLHRFQYRSHDAAGNEENIRSMNLGIVGAAESVPPVTTVSAVPSVPVVYGYTTGSWMVTMSCDDSNGGAGGSGCLRTEYGQNGGAFVAYSSPLVLSQPGIYTIRYRSIDVLNNTEATRILQLIVAGPDTTPPYTGVELDSTARSVLEPSRSMTPWTILFSCTDEAFRPPDQVASGCARTEYRLDGGAFQPAVGNVVLSAVGEYTVQYRSIDVAGNLGEIETIALEVVASSDLDQDGALDFGDNCHLVANPDQLDSDGDSFGNRCDPDFNQNGTVDSNDASLLKARIGASADSAPDQDLDGDGFVTAADMNLLKAKFRRPPGPSHGYDYFGFPD